ncbi:MAG: UDP-3-O-(3-hydroxymyristoyl)glucosamine N-acyltransferase [Saprospiraceae bacterium]|nr:MAG: UDP-3-O-(3-hydroxymyristoyl) glucosamine N-acyltransferase [Bacteroidetes bacterium OLB9]MCO6463270.1 UDP-3-O-(3-hydroxymyristoyl)glucosamine N-acyltransferase [Saprospiraceae bacterium]MCZ2337300.1 UDP-3-O-(3-hydroxymyristoyl)glucosamine N-acyltransferase [Chitinophagales bacterium]
MEIKAWQIAQLINGKVVGDDNAVITGPSKIEEGKPGTITFLANPKYKDYIYTTQASVVLVSNDFKPEHEISTTLIQVDNVYLALSQLMEQFNSGISVRPQVASTAVVDDSVIFGDNVAVDDYVIIKPGVTIGNNTKIYGQVYIGDRVKIGADVTIYPGVKIYHNCEIGDRCVIHANAVIGSDGFGFVRDDKGNYKKIHQIGNVVIQNDVEIGSNTVIDRGSMGSTVIGAGVKLDNLIQIAHNVHIGNNTAIAAQAGIAGSTSVGKDCIIGGQVGIVGHIQIADGTMIQAQSGVASTIKKDGTKLYGSPAIEYQNYLKSYAWFKKLPELVAQLQALQNALDDVANSR